MKKESVIVGIIGIFIFFMGFTPTAFSAPILYIEPPHNTPLIGQPFDVEVKISDAPSLITYSFQIMFDGVELDFHSISETPPPPLTPIGATSPADGPINNIGGFALTGFSAPGDYTLATITFTAELDNDLDPLTIDIWPNYRPIVDGFVDSSEQIFFPDTHGASVSAVPIPSTLLLLGSGILGLLGLWRRQG
jgi:hypothetical protein